MCRDHPAGLAPLGMVPTHSVDPPTLGRNIPICHSPPSSIVTLLFFLSPADDVRFAICTSALMLTSPSRLYTTLQWNLTSVAKVVLEWSH